MSNGFSVLLFGFLVIVVDEAEVLLLGHVAQFLRVLGVLDEEKVVGVVRNVVIGLEAIADELHFVVVVGEKAGGNGVQKIVEFRNF